MARKLFLCAAILASAFAGAGVSAAAAEPGTLAPESVSWAKRNAILGGASSALEAILAQQGVPVDPGARLQPASYSLPRAQTSLAARNSARVANLNNRPDVFGSVALPIRHSPLDKRWARVAQQRVGGAPARFAHALRNADALTRVEAINRYVNERVRFVEDRIQHGQADVWSSASQTLSIRRGDCEDFAIAKLQMLRRSGLSDQDLYFTIVKDLVTRSDHAVLIVRLDGRMLVLDNGTDELLENEAIKDYRPVLTFAANGSWTHGYRLRPQAIEVAAAEQAMKLEPGDGTQRSRNASLLAFDTGFSK